MLSQKINQLTKVFQKKYFQSPLQSLQMNVNTCFVFVFVKFRVNMHLELHLLVPIDTFHMPFIAENYHKYYTHLRDINPCSFFL